MAQVEGVPAALVSGLANGTALASSLLPQAGASTSAALAAASASLGASLRGVGALGAAMHVGGSVLIVAGQTVVKVAHCIQESSGAPGRWLAGSGVGGRPGPVPRWRRPDGTWVPHRLGHAGVAAIGWLAFAVGNLLRFAAMRFAAQTVLSGLGSLQFVLIPPASRLLLGVRGGASAIGGVLLVLAGNCLILTGGPGERDFSLDQLRSLWGAPPMRAFLLSAFVIVLLAHAGWVECERDRVGDGRGGGRAVGKSREAPRGYTELATLDGGGGPALEPVAPAADGGPPAAPGDSHGTSPGPGRATPRGSRGGSPTPHGTVEVASHSPGPSPLSLAPALPGDVPPALAAALALPPFVPGEEGGRAVGDAGLATVWAVPSGGPAAAAALPFPPLPAPAPAPGALRVLTSATLFSAVAALLGAWSVLFGKSLTYIFTALPGSVRDPYSWVAGAAFFVSAGFWVRQSDRGLRIYPALLIMPLMHAFWMCASVLQGGIYFRELEQLPAASLFLLSLGLGLALLGALVMGIAGYSDERAREAGATADPGAAYPLAAPPAALAAHGPSVLHAPPSSAGDPELARLLGSPPELRPHAPSVGLGGARTGGAVSLRRSTHAAASGPGGAVPGLDDSAHRRALSLV